MHHVNIIKRLEKEGINFCCKTTQNYKNTICIQGKAFHNEKEIRWQSFLYREKEGYECGYFYTGDLFQDTFETFDTIKTAIKHLKGV